VALLGVTTRPRDATYNARVTSSGDAVFATPGTSRGLISVVTDYRYLLRRIIRKEMLVRYRGSVLGWAWSYAKPATQFLVFWLAIGVFLGANASVQYYPIYLISGMILLNLFSESFSNATKSLSDNSSLIQKIYLPREIFPVSTTLIAIVNFLPQVVILLIVCIAVGWHPTVLSVLAIVAAIAIVALLSTGLGLFFGAINVSFRDAQNFVELILMVAMWGSPVLYRATVLENAPEWIQVVYFLNPVTPAVELMHYGFWGATLTDGTEVAGFTWYSLVAFATAVVMLLVGQFVFRKLEGRFAQDL
jgi:ABC-2 type transport system permease protein